jgi:chromate transport protein ChrA
MTMDLQPSETLGRLRWPLYFIAIGLIAIPLLDFVTSVLPLQPYDMRWRFATVALFSGFLFTPLLGMVIVCLVATFSEDRLMQRFVAVVNLLATLSLVALMIMYALDVVQLRNSIGVQEQAAFDMSALRAMAKYLFMVVALVWLGVAGFRVSRLRRSTRATRGMAPLVSTTGQ